MMFILLAIGILFYWLYQENNKLKGKKVGFENAMTTLQQRFVMGEVDEETYLRMKKIINE